MIHAVTDRRACRADRGEPRRDVGPDRSGLHRPEALRPGGERSVGPLGRALQLPERRIRRDPRARRPEQGGTGCPAAWPMMSRQGRLQRPVAPGVEVDRLDRRHVAGDSRGSWPMNRSAKAANPSMVSPEPNPVMPSSVSTRTMVAAKERRAKRPRRPGRVPIRAARTDPVEERMASDPHAEPLSGRRGSRGFAAAGPRRRRPRRPAAHR